MKTILIKHPNFIAAALLLLIIGVAIIPYLPGITGPFMLDSSIHIKKLKQFTDYPAWQRMFLLATANDIGSPWLSRPLSFLTLMISDWHWPTNPWHFKYTNILIHAINAVLIFWLLLKFSTIALGQNLRSYITPLAVVLAGATTILWAAHPLQVSTVLYVIQRMTELGALFTIAALLSFLAGRLILAERPWQGYALMTGGMLVFTTLGFLSKQIAVLVFVYVLVIEFFLLRPHSVAVPRHYKYWLGLIVVLPILLVLTHLISQAPEFAIIYETYRDFSLSERLLTQARILFDYLHSILLPRLQGTGLYHDDFLISTGLLSPLSTILAILGIVGLIVGSFVLRRRFPVLAFGIIWFFAGHLLESTAIPLELYFEHRNYLPMLGPLFVVVFYALTITTRLKQITRSAVIVSALLLTALTASNSWAWASLDRMLWIWNNEHPASVRSNHQLAGLAAAKGDFETAKKIVERQLQSTPKSLSLQLMALRLECTLQEFEKNSLEHFIVHIPSGHVDNGAVASHAGILAEQALNQSCSNLSVQAASNLMGALLLHSVFNQETRAKRINQIGYNIASHRAGIFFEQGKYNHAMAALDEAFNYYSYAKAPLSQADFLIRADLPEHAKQYLNKAKQANCPQTRGVIGFMDRFLPCKFDGRIERLEAKIEGLE